MKIALTSFGIGSALALALLLAPAPARACGGSSGAKATTAERSIQKVSATTLASMIKDARSYGTSVFVYDVNSAQTRSKLGVVPGAKLLTSSQGFTVAELPEDKSAGLVFYCANTRCGASKEAAKRAVQAGYHNVAIMPEGIAGWREAGFETKQANI